MGKEKKSGKKTPWKSVIIIIIMVTYKVVYKHIVVREEKMLSESLPQAPSNLGLFQQTAL